LFDFDEPFSVALPMKGHKLKAGILVFVGLKAVKYREVL